MGESMREELAALMHEMWIGWMKYLFSKSRQHGWDDGRVIIPAWAVERWMRQMDTPYDELSEEEKDSDRRIADRVLALIEKSVWGHWDGSLVDLPLFQSYYEKQESVVRDWLDNDAMAQVPVVNDHPGCIVP